jgi:WASH complex subunit strumpellin
MKFSSILNTPMNRIFQARTPDLEPVSKFYSEELVTIVKIVLQVIPQVVFKILDKIIDTFTNKLKD